MPRVYIQNETDTTIDIVIAEVSKEDITSLSGKKTISGNKLGDAIKSYIFKRLSIYPLDKMLTKTELETLRDNANTASKIISVIGGKT